MKPKLHAFRALNQDERRFLIQAWLLLPFLDLALRLLPYKHVQRVAAASQRRQGLRDEDSNQVLGELQQYAQLVAVAAHYHIQPLTCLRQSLALQTLLARRGIKTELRLGVRKEGNGLEAHAWLTYDGLPIAGPHNAVERFVPLV